MAKNQPHPASGGGYSLDPATGKRTQLDGTLPPLTAQELIDGWVDGPAGRQPPAKPAAEASAAAGATESKKR